MEQENIIKLDNISKSYNLYKNNQDRFKEALHPRRKKYHQEFFALKNIDLEVKRADSLGILGLNGAGKSTLLKIITGVVTPTKGIVQINGSISAILELGSGFNPEFSGYDNVFFYGAVMGFSRDQMKEKIDDIIKFADIGDFIYQPVKTYSTGMKSRLAFSVATSINPDILILDEVLSVGDMFFQAKCTERMQSMIKSENTTVLFVSHSLGNVKSICKNCILLQHGEIIARGSTAEVVDEYLNIQIKSRQRVIDKQIRGSGKKDNTQDLKTTESKYRDLFTNNSDFIKRASYKRIQNGKAEFVNCVLLDENEKEIRLVEYGQTVILRIALIYLENITKSNIGFHIQNKGVSILYATSITENKYINNIRPGDKYIINFIFKLELQHGLYNILIACHVPNKGNYIPENADFADYVTTAYQFEMATAKPRAIHGYVHINNSMDIIKLN